MEQESKPSLLMELDSWQNLIHSDDWRVFIRLLKTHQDYLQRQVNELLAQHEDRRAGEELAKLNDCKKLVGLVQTRINDLKQQNKGGE